MKIYDIEYNYEKKVEFEVEEQQIPGALKGEFENFNNVEEEHEDFEDIEIVNAHMQIGGFDFKSATMEAVNMLDSVFLNEEDEENEESYDYEIFPDGYEIVGVVEIQGLNILNWPGEGEPCDCPQCKAKLMADEDVMVFNCPDCQEEIKVPIDGWELVLCRKCECQILRSGVINLGNNKYTYLKLEDKEGG